MVQVVGFTVQGSRLTSMQYGVACSKNRMNSPFIFKLNQYFRLMIRQYFISLTLNPAFPNYISDFLGLIYLTIWLMDLSEPEIQFEII